MANKYFLIIYPNRDDDYWVNIKTLIPNNRSYSDGYNINGMFTLYFYHTDNKINEQELEAFLKNCKINPNDEIIIFGHEYFSGHPGISKDTLENVKKTYKNLEYLLFSTSYPDEYPCLLLYGLNRSIDKNKKLNISQPEITLVLCGYTKKIIFNWDTLKEEVKKKDLSKLFSLIKHRIAHLFLPEYFSLLFQEEKRENLEIKNKEIKKRAEDIIDNFAEKYKEILKNEDKDYLKGLFHFQNNSSKIQEMISKFDSEINKIIKEGK